MKISALIKKLEKLQDKYGDLDVMYQDGDGDRVWPVEHLEFQQTEVVIVNGGDWSGLYVNRKLV